MPVESTTGEFTMPVENIIIRNLFDPSTLIIGCATIVGLISTIEGFRRLFLSDKFKLAAILCFIFSLACFWVINNGLHII